MITSESHPEPGSEHLRAVDTESSLSQGPLAEPDTPEGSEIPGEGANPREKRLALLALLLLVPAPSLGVALSMMIDGTQGTTLGKAAYFMSKIWILALPIVWLIWIDKVNLSSRPKWPVRFSVGTFSHYLADLARNVISFSPARKGGFGIAAGLGLLFGGAIIGGFWLFGDLIIDPVVLRDAATTNGIGSLPVYLGFVAYLTLVNSLLEEYVWRWFVFRKCETLVGGGAAVICSALFFTIHHVFALKAQMGWTPTLLGSTGVFIGGAAWSWCYLRFRSVWPGYVSHLIVDAAVFSVGWYLIFG